MILMLVLLTVFGFISFDLYNVCLTLLSIIVTTINTVISLGGIKMKTFIMIGTGIYGVMSKRCWMI